MGVQRFDVVVPRDEWSQACKLLKLVAHDETSALGFVRLRGDGRRRRWYATDSFRAAVLDGEPDDRMFDVGLSAQLMRFGHAVSNWATEVRVRVEGDDDVIRVGVQGDDAWLWTVDQAHEFPDFSGDFPDDDSLKGSATVEAGRLLAMAMAAQHERRRGEDHERPMWLAVGDGHVVGSVDWGRRLGEFEYGLNVDNARGDVMVRVDAQHLESLLELFEPRAELRVGLPKYVDRPLVFSDGDMTALLIPIRTPEQMLRSHIEDVIKEVVGPLGLVRDSDGDYPLVRRGTPVFARLWSDHDAAVLQVFAVLVHDIAPSPELHSELNDLNTSSTFARLFHVDDQVLAEVDLAADTLDAHELRIALNRITVIAHEVMPTLAAVLGGNVINDPAVERGQAYRNTVVEAEVTPGALVAITGPNAVEPWPFPGVVHVITGWNPQGVLRDDEYNASINRSIAEDIIAQGGRFVHGVGRAAGDQDDYAEPSLVVWGLDRGQAVTMGYRASQDAIFEITETEVRLVSCFDDTVETWSRVG